MSEITVPFYDCSSFFSCDCSSSFFGGVVTAVFYIIVFKLALNLINTQTRPEPVRTEEVYVNNSLEQLSHTTDIHYVVGPKQSGKSTLATQIASTYSRVFAHFDTTSDWPSIREGLGGHRVVILDQCTLSPRQMKNHIDYIQSVGVKCLIVVGGANTPGSWIKHREPDEVYLTGWMGYNKTEQIYNVMDKCGDLCFTDGEFVDHVNQLMELGDTVVVRDGELYSYSFNDDFVRSEEILTDHYRSTLARLQRKSEEFVGELVQRSRTIHRLSNQTAQLERQLTCNKNLLKKSRDKVKSLRKKLRNNSRHRGIRPERYFREPILGSSYLTGFSPNDWPNDTLNLDPWSVEPVDSNFSHWVAEPLEESEHVEDEQERARDTICKAVLDWNVARKWRRLAEGVRAHVLPRFQARSDFGAVLDELKSTRGEEPTEISIVAHNMSGGVVAFDTGVDPNLDDFIEVDDVENLERAMGMDSGKVIWCTFDLTHRLEDKELVSAMTNYSPWIGFHTDLSMYCKERKGVELFVFDPTMARVTKRRGVYFNVFFHGVSTFQTFEVICGHFKGENALLCYSAKNKRIEWMKKM